MRTSMNMASAINGPVNHTSHAKKGRSVGKVAKLLQAHSNIKHRTLLMTAYATGLRASRC